MARRRGRTREGGCASRLPHDTPGMTKGDSVRVHYPFHPLYDRELRVFVAARSPDGAVTVEDTKQIRLKIPLWMLAPAAARFEVVDAPSVAAQALLGLVELCDLQRAKIRAPEFHSPVEPSHETTLVDPANAAGGIEADS